MLRRFASAFVGTTMIDEAMRRRNYFEQIVELDL
jgi:hypothetical protein